MAEGALGGNELAGDALDVVAGAEQDALDVAPGAALDGNEPDELVVEAGDEPAVAPSGDEQSVAPNEDGYRCRPEP